jgi:hypothetical protein
MKKIQSRDIKGVANPGAIAKRDVERWYSLLSESLKEVEVEPAEAVVMIYAAHRWLSIMNGDRLDILPEQLLQNMGLDGFYRDAQYSLAEKVQGWALGTRAALWDAAERYEVAAYREPTKTFGAILHQVGLHSYELRPEELAVVERIRAAESDVLPAAYMNAMNGKTK